MKRAVKGAKPKPVEPRHPMTQAQIKTEVAARTHLSPSQVNAVWVETWALAEEELYPKEGSGEFQPPRAGFKLFRKAKPYLPEREGRNPATGEPMMLKERPASWDIKLRKMKDMKECISLMDPPDDS